MDFTSGQSWAPSGLKYDGDNDGEDEYYVFYTNGGATGYVMSDSPTGPWRDPLGTALFSGSTPNCSDCSTCFDPAVLVDDKVTLMYIWRIISYVRKSMPDWF